MARFRERNRERIKIEGAPPPDDRVRVVDGVSIEPVEEGERFMIREEENVSEEGVKGSEKAAIGAYQNNMDEARVGRVRRVCKCVPLDPPPTPPRSRPRQRWQAPSPGGGRPPPPAVTGAEVDGWGGSIRRGRRRGGVCVRA